MQLKSVATDSNSFSQTDDAEMASGRFRVAFSKVKTRLNYRKPIYPYKNYENINLPIWSIKIYKKTMYVCMNSKQAEPILMKFSNQLQISPAGDPLEFGSDNSFFSATRAKPLVD